MKKTIGFLVGFVTGATVGATLGILLAPEKGEETRAKLMDSYDKTKDRLSVSYEKTKDKVMETLKKKGVTLTNDELDDLVEDIKSEVEEATA